MSPKTGEIWWVDFGVKQKNRPAKLRPALVIAPFETDEWEYNNHVMVPITKRYRDKPSDVTIIPSDENGLPVKCYAQCELLTSMPSSTCVERMGVIDPDNWQRIRWIVQSILGFS